MHARLHLACYDQLCRPDVSLGAHCSLRRSFLGNLKLRRRNLRWAMSIKSDDANFLTITCIRICLKMNQRPSRQRRSVPRWRGELRRRILKQRWVDLFLLSYISLTHLCAQERPEIELVPIASTTKERSSVEDRRVTETNSNAAVREQILILPSLWRTSESRNRLKTPGRSFLQQQNISRPPDRKSVV